MKSTSPIEESHTFALTTDSAGDPTAGSSPVPAPAERHPFRRFDAFYVLAIAALFLFFFRSIVPSIPFAYDESDYMSAARKGIVENYRETTSMPLPDFVSVGLQVLHGQLTRTGLSEYVRVRKDLTFYRHYHGPLYYQWLAAITKLVGVSEVGMRTFGFLFHLLTFATVYLGIVWLFGARYRMPAIAASLLYLFGANNVSTSVELSAHVLFLWTSIATLILIARFAQIGSLRRYHAAVAGCALSFCVLEYAVLLFVSLLVAVVLVRKDFFKQWRVADYLRWASLTVAVVVGVCLLLWPAGVLKGTAVEGFAYISYLSRFRRGSYGDTTALGTWKTHLTEAPVEFAVFFALFVIALSLVWRCRHRNVLLPLLTYGTLLFLSTFKNTAAAPRYISSLFAPVLFVSAVVLFDWLKPLRARSVISTAGAVLGVILVLFYNEIRAGIAPHARPSESRLLLDYVQQHQNERFLIPAIYLPVVQYYYPDTYTRSYTPGTDLGAIQSSARAQSYDVVCGFGMDTRNAAFRTGFTGQFGELACQAN